MSKMILVRGCNINCNLVIKQDDVGDFMLILYEGKARIIVDGNEVAQKNPNDVMGEAAL